MTFLNFDLFLAVLLPFLVLFCAVCPPYNMYSNLSEGLYSVNNRQTATTMMT